jgi:hypothetical protein
VDEVVAMSFKLGPDGLLHNEMCDAELARIERLRERARKGGRASAAKRWGSRHVQA